VSLGAASPYLRHRFASFAAGGGRGLPIIGKLLAHTQASTTQRYAYLDADPLHRVAEHIGGEVAADQDPDQHLPRRPTFSQVT
jgi:integrase